MRHLPVTFLTLAVTSVCALAACGGGSATGTGGGTGGGTGTTTSSSGTGGSTTGTGGSGGDAPLTSFTPQGCAFSITPRAEYQGFSLAKPFNSATPDIRRVRLGLGGNVDVGAAGRADPSTSIAVAWQTDDDTLATEIAWGTDPDPAKWSATDRTSGVTWLLPGGSSTLPNERMHEVYVCGLTPATTYYYRVGGGAAGSEVWGDVQSFSTTPAAGSTPITIGVTGDSRGESGDAWRAAQRRIAALSPTIQLFSGDMINLALDQTAWEHWLDSAWRDADQKDLTLSRILTLNTHGNHENHTSFFFNNLVLPQDNAKYPKYAELFYSFDVGPVHLVVIDDAWVVSPSTDPDGPGTYAGALSAWLDADLAKANANRANVPWIITMHHHSELSSANHGDDADVLRGRKFLMPIWDKYQVDLNIAGHDHNYERSKPQVISAAGDPTDPPAGTRGTVYVVCAGTGAPAYTAGTSAFTAVSHDWVDGSAIGVYALVTADATNLKLDAYELRTDASDPIFDTVTLKK
jgi:hypothetical protein